MNFERGKDIKESLGLGLKANPFILFSMFLYRSYKDHTPKDEDKLEIIYTNPTKRILEGIESGEIRGGVYGYDKYYVHIRIGEEPVTTLFNKSCIYPLKDFCGKYIKFNGILYLIPPR